MRNVWKALQQLEREGSTGLGMQRDPELRRARITLRNHLIAALEQANAEDARELNRSTPLPGASGRRPPPTEGDFRSSVDGSGGGWVTCLHCSAMWSANVNRELFHHNPDCPIYSKSPE